MENKCHKPLCNRNNIGRLYNTMKARILNLLLLTTFLITIMAPITGMVVHKLASTAFLLLCLLHTFVYRKNMNGKRYLALAVILIAFASGILALICEDIVLVLAIHKVVSIAAVFILAIHIFVFHRRMFGKDSKTESQKRTLGINIGIKEENLLH